MDAKTAREKAERFNQSAVSKQWIKIKNQIEEAAQRGKFEIIILEGLHKDVKSMLYEEGFSVNETDYRNETQVNISW